MNPELFTRLKEILLTLPRLAGSDREGYLAEACGDEGELRELVESILAKDAEVPEVLRTGALADLLKSGIDADVPIPTGGSVPPRIGPYTILGVLGEGGMGIVYRAQQTEPIRREVALKLIKRGMDTDQVVSRFEAERQTLALMDHPNIAKVLDAGASDRGRPYFVMEIVRGTPITEYCSQNDLQVRERLEIFLTVCKAIQHAHQNGVIHRDLKPSNILVTARDGEPAPKIIDFGIAKAIDDRPGGRTLLTQQGQLVGTPEYMSPEQARGDPKGIDLRTDIYSLGVILYELLTGELPYETKGAAIVEVARIICEEPPRPIRRQGTGTGRVDRDVETIVLKALAKEPDRRYYSAAALAEDIERSLTSRPILARPPSTLYQLRKLVARHRIPFALLGLLFALLVVFGITMTTMYRTQTRERGRAELQSEKAQRFNEYMKTVLADVVREVGGEVGLVKRILDAAASRTTSELEDDPEVRAEVLGFLGDQYHSVELSEQAIEMYREAAVSRIGGLQQRHPGYADRLEPLRERMNGTSRLAPDQLALADPAGIRDRELKDGLASAAGAIQGVAYHLWAMGQYEEAEAVFREALSIWRTLAPSDTEATSFCLKLLADTFRRQGRYAEAERGLRDALAFDRNAFGDASLKVGTTYLYLGDALLSQNKHADAEQAYREALARLRPPTGEGFPVNAMATQAQLAKALLRQGRGDEAESIVVESLEWRKEFFGADHARVAKALYVLTTIRLVQGRCEDAVATAREAVRLIEARVGRGQAEIVGSLIPLGSALCQCGMIEEAEPVHRRAAELAREILGDSSPMNADALYGLGSTLLEDDRAQEAETPLRECIEIRQSLLPENDWRIAAPRVLLGACLGRLGRFDEGEPLIRENWPRVEAQGYPPNRKPVLRHVIRFYEESGQAEIASTYRARLSKL